MTKRQGTPKEWKAMGDEIKDIRNQLLEFNCNPNYQALLTKKELNLISQALKYIDKFRSHAEDRMVAKCETLPPNWQNVFFGQEVE
ncbi:hypothetical protein [Desulfolucanica intricata]|uniref:hypothetical protein n=1 Tax=Desulfolucanica intricata TaxID=1285191 RepID=UPI00082A0DA2|nr:hypothetical protein [Desulfolucanica intricata]